MTSQVLKIFKFHVGHRIPRVKIGLYANFQLFNRFSSQVIKGFPFLVPGDPGTAP